MPKPSGIQRITVDPDNPNSSTVTEAARIIKKVGLVGLPTETFYALAANGLNRNAVDRVLAAKGRPDGKPLGLLLADRNMIEMVTTNIPPFAVTLIEEFWPGPLSLILDAKQNLPKGVLGEGNGVSVRVPGCRLAAEVTRQAKVPLTATSANYSGTNPPKTPEDVIRNIGEHLDLVLEAGETPGGLPSTMVDVRKKEPVLIREGAIPWEKIVKLRPH